MPNKGRNGNGGNGNGSKKKNGKKNGSAKRGTRNVGSLVQGMVSAALANNSSNRRPMLQGLSRQRGSDFLGKVTVQPAPATAAARVIATFPVSPSAYPGTRLSQISELWERYKFNSFSVRYVSAVPNTVACQLVLYIDTDPTDDPTVIMDVDSLIRQAVSQAGSQQWNFNQSKTTKLAIRSDGQLMYTGIDKLNKRFTQQGTAYLVQITNPINFNGEPISSALEAGSLFLDWDISFQIAQINPAAVVPRIPDVPVYQLYEQTYTFLNYPASIIITADNPGTAGQISARGSTFEVMGSTTQNGFAAMELDTVRIAILSFSAGDEYESNTEGTIIVPGVHAITFASSIGLIENGQQRIKFTAGFPFTVIQTPSSAPAPRSPPFSVKLDNLRRMLAECMTESNVPTGNAMGHNPADDIYDRPSGYDVEANTYPAWDDEGLLDDDDPEYDAKYARRCFAEELGDHPSHEPIGEPIVITAQTIDINTNVHISDDTRSKIDTAVRVIMTQAPELCPYSLIVPFIRDELDTDAHLDIDNDPEDF